VQNLLFENEFNLHVNENSFSCERLCTKICFKKEAARQLWNGLHMYCVIPENIHTPLTEGFLFPAPLSPQEIPV